MKISIYTCARNALYNDYHFLHMLRHHLPLADEIVVHEGFSTDGTYEAIANLDPKVRIIRSDWDRYPGMDFINHAKDEARRHCTGDWCILLDADEFIPEWSFEKLRHAMATTNRLTLAMTVTNFYGNYRVYVAEPARFRWPWLKVNIHRNIPEIEMAGGDASSVKAAGEELVMDPHLAVCELHHFGYVRKPARLRQAWRNMRGRLYNAPPPRLRLPGWLFDLFPHNWLDPDIIPALALYTGAYMQTVLADPGEFIRDRMLLYHFLRYPIAAKATGE
ncbi:MAG: glycosyltransferase family 2 protein [Gemmataceae bacterium]|nr:glycosyltransferase family 2 protein [Gemmata sp.]MDW8198388.1 glycosyltransferase family 2 protein [Gemmataceae bacterium]